MAAATKLPGGVSQPAWMRNCSLSRPRVTGEANSTRWKRGEFSKTGMSVLAAAACPVISTPLLSRERVVSQASAGRSSVSSRSTGSGRIAEDGSDSIVVASFRFCSRSRTMRSTVRTSASRFLIDAFTVSRRRCSR